MFPRHQNQTLFKFADLILLFSVTINYLNYQQNIKQANTSKEISENLKKINNDGIVHKLLDHIEKEN